MTKTMLESVTSILEVVTYIGTFCGAGAGVGYLVFNRQLGRIKESELNAERITNETKLSEARTGAFVAQERAANAEASLLRLRLEAAARRLTGPQKDRLRQRLEAHPEPIVVMSRLLDGESADFADDFAAAFTDAHWRVLRLKNWLHSGPGVFIAAVGESLKTPEIALLGSALTDIGVAHEIMPLAKDDSTMNPHAQEHVLYLLIGAHPPVEPATTSK